MSSPTERYPSGATSEGMPRILMMLLGFLGVITSLWVLSQIGNWIAPVFLALNLVIAAYPVHRWLVSRGAPSQLAVVVMMLVAIVILVLAVASLVWAISVLVNEVPNYSEQYWALYNNVVEFAARWGVDGKTISDLLGRIDPNAAVNAVSSLISTTSGFIGLVSIVLASMIFMVMDTPSMKARMRIAANQRPQITTALESFATGVRRYWMVTTIFGLIVAVLDWLALIILDVPLAMVWALFSFLTNYIPNIGFIIGVIPPALIALLANGWQTALLVVIVYSVLNFVTQSIIQPRFTGESVGVTPTISFISLLLWGWVFGALGTLIALPMTLLVKALLIDGDPKARWLNTLISTNWRDMEEFVDP